ncbi:hypothetical protein I6G82_04935 [Lysinibacillus macroides]|uniref:Lipoprotein n=2 Tax=Lysinibacillus macroides TaxID=33935 RepID=A0A0N0CUV9_9BACI|nr:hypothetical protein ADM90_17055 [Lysinibacillus macroides]QPR68972.1 hypothetical protein I6G82_04935 [Lysinibacillus macroides]
MKWMTKLAWITCMCALLSGCGERFAEIKDAASGINAAADSAASAVSRDVHAIRAMAINYGDTTFTVNDLFKTILRDIRWDYDLEKDELHVRGTWQPPIFSDQAWDQEMTKKLAEAGIVNVICKITDDTLDPPHTTITLSYKDEIILEQSGEEALYQLYDTFLHP